MPNDRCPKCGGRMFYDDYEDEYYCANCGYRIEARKWVRLQALQSRNQNTPASGRELKKREDD